MLHKQPPQRVSAHRRAWAVATAVTLCPSTSCQRRRAVCTAAWRERARKMRRWGRARKMSKWGPSRDGRRSIPGMPCASRCHKEPPPTTCSPSLLHVPPKHGDGAPKE